MIRADQPEFVAERELEAVDSDGKVIPIVIRIGKPYPELGGKRWACPVWFDGLEAPFPDIRGVDSVQAIALAISFARTMIGHRAKRGMTFRWPNGDPVAPDMMFS